MATLRSKLRDEGAHNLLHRVSCQVLYPALIKFHEELSSSSTQITLLAFTTEDVRTANLALLSTKAKGNYRNSSLCIHSTFQAEVGKL